MRSQLQILKVVAWLFALAGFVAPAPAQLTPPPADTLTNAAQIRSLSASELAHQRRVQLHAVVVDQAYPVNQALIVADATSGIYVLAEKNLFAPYHRGDWLELKGVTDPGEFAPIVKINSVHKLGTAPIPSARKVTYQELLTGAMDAQWVEISGVVRQCLAPASTNANIWRILVNVDGGSVAVRLPTPRDPQIQEDAEVRLQGICLYQFNQKRQVLNPVLQMPRGVPVHIKKAAPTNPFSAPVRSANSLLLFAPESAAGHRIHVRGIVTHAQTGALVWIRDESSGLRLQTYQAENLSPGDKIDVLGFPTYGFFSPVLEDAIFQKTGSGPAPAPLTFTNFSDAFDHEDDLVATEARLIEVQPTLDGAAFTLRLNGKAFKAVLKLAADQKIQPEWQAGSRVRITGICSVVHDEVRPMMGIWHPQSFQIQLRSAADLQVLQPPPWWTPGHVILVLGAVIGGLLLVTSVVTLVARRRLNEQTHQRAMAEAEFTAILSERNRMAREIHDTLAQGLVATSVQLRLAKKQTGGGSAELQQHLDTAQQLVRGSLEEARNSIWNMRSQVLETGDLPGALKNILKQMTDGTKLKTSFEITGRARRLAPVVENNCLRVGQEAITNAAKHARANEIKVSLEYDEKFLRLVVTDDGRGFDPAQPPPSEGGFGLVGIRERAVELKATLDIRRAPDHGTEIHLCIPLSGE